MILSRGRRYLFIHIPKTGGTSMALALEARAMKDDILVGDTPKARRRRHRVQEVQTAGRLWKHSAIRDLIGLVRPDELEELFCFTMVRNPWDRVVSYYHWLRGQSFDHAAVRLAKARDFRGFLNAPETQASLRAAPAASYMTWNDRNWCDLYLRLEHLEADLLPLSAHLGFDLALPRENVSTRERDYRSYYSDADARLLSQICEKDVREFGYRFE